MKRLPLFILTLLMVACSSIDCPVQNTVSSHFFLYKSDGTALELNDTLTISTKKSDGKDTVLFNRGIGIRDFKLGMKDFQIPISYSHPEDIQVFTFSNANNDLFVVDTVWVKKEDIPHFESVDCNAAFFHRLTDVRYTHNYIDSIVINNPSVDYDQTAEHFRIYTKARN